MKTKKPTTVRSTRSQVRSALKRMWMVSPERRAALKASGYCCEDCGVKASKAKGREQVIEVHHKDGANLEKVIDAVFEYLLHEHTRLSSRCPDCHNKFHPERIKK